MNVRTAIGLFPLLSAALLSAGTDSQTVTLERKTEIPGATLNSGEYTFEVEDRLQDRAIIRITDLKKKSHELVLAVPNEKLEGAQPNQVLLLQSSDGKKQALQGWKCASCTLTLEVVYPKKDAVKLTGEMGKPVLAVDPTYDKLPKNLSADDMKVVTLWLLKPKEVTPDQKGKGLEAAKWADVAPKTTQMAEAKRAEEPVAPASPQGTPAAPVTSSAEAAPATPAAPETQTAPVAPAAPVAPSAPEAPSPTPAAPTQTSSAVTADRPATPVVEASAAEPASKAHARRMPHTASNTFELAFLGMGAILAGLGLHLQRRLAQVPSKS